MRTTRNARDMRIIFCSLCLTLLISACTGRTNSSENIDPQNISNDYTPGYTNGITYHDTSGEPISGTLIFVEETNGIDDGISRLVNSMKTHGLDLYQTADSPNGLIGENDVVLLKINSQWADRGGTNTDLLRATIQALLDHPSGFRGEIIVADNGQAQFGSERAGGSLEWRNNNAVDRSQSVMHVIRDFQAEGHRVTGVLWDKFTLIKVAEFSADDMRDGFVVEDYIHRTGTDVSYPKFTTEFGTHVSFKNGIWDESAGKYNHEKLKMINMPVLKAHFIFQVTGAVKNYMGVPSARLTSMRPHNSVGTGGMGTIMVETRMPVLNILDMIWIGPSGGPDVPDVAAVRVNKIAASVDAFALDYWASKNILMPEAEKVPGGRAASMNPDGTTPGTFGYWLKLSISELYQAGIPATIDESEIVVITRS